LPGLGRIGVLSQHWGDKDTGGRRGGQEHSSLHPFFS
jgi:hypothetical protein